MIENFYFGVVSMRLPFAFESLDHGHVFRVTIWQKQFYDLLLRSCGSRFRGQR